MQTTITPPTAVGDEIYRLQHTTLAAQNFASVLSFALELAVSLSDRQFTRRVFETIARFLHSMGIGQTRVAELTLDGKPALVKLECENAGGSYKSRGAYLGVASAGLSGARELVTASTGNHGIGVNLAAAAFEIALKIFLPTKTSANKLALLSGPRTEIRFVEGEFAHAKRAAQQYARETGAVFVAPYDSSEAICGQATVGVEIAGGGS
jgi:threonine synthase